MLENSEIQKLKNQYPEFFKEVSPEFLDFLFSEETQSKIAEICLEQEIEDEEKIEKIAYRIGLVLFGQVPKENFAEMLKNGVDLNREVAERISVEVNRRIFSQSPEILKKEGEPTRPTPPSPGKPEVGPPPEVKPEIELKKARGDIYREPIE